MNPIKSILISVGTTKFENLIKCIDDSDFYKKLDELNIEKLFIQKGNGVNIPDKYKEIKFKNLKVEVVEYVKNLQELLSSYDVIVCHCGAGTILESVQYKKIIIGCTNDSLMDNHQKELADRLVEKNYIYHSDYTNIKSKIVDVISGKEKPLTDYPDFNYDIIPNVIYNMLDIN